MEFCFVSVFWFLAFVFAFNNIFCSPICQDMESHVENHSHKSNHTSRNSLPGHKISRKSMHSLSIENSASLNQNDLLHGNISNITQMEYIERKEGTIRVIDNDIEQNCTDHGTDCIINTKHFGCVCALFEKQYPDTDDIPLMSKTFDNVSCHEHIPGEDACTEVCISFAMSYYEVRDIMLCTYAPNAKNITGYLQTKMCADDSKWMYTGLSNSTPLCCNLGQVVECNNATISSEKPFTAN